MPVQKLSRRWLMFFVMGLLATATVGVRPAAAQQAFSCTVTNNANDPLDDTATITWTNIDANGYDLIKDNQPKRWTTNTTYTDTTPGTTYKIVAFGNGTDFTTTTCTNPNNGGGGDDLTCTVTNNANGSATITWTNIDANGYDLIKDNQPKRWTTNTTYTDTTPGTTYKIVAFGNGTDFTTTTCTNPNNGGGGGGGQPPGEGTITLLAAGDIGRCDSPDLAAVGSYVESRTDAWFMALGDLAYPDGSRSDFNRCYDPHFAEAKTRTLPVVGNHEYYTSGAAGYVDYFGAAAGPADKLYYSRDLGKWHIIALNGDCWRVGGCGVGDPQYRWLQQDLAANDRACILVGWHQAYYTSESPTGDATYMRPYYELLDAEGADVLLTGHSHNYERFHRMDADNRVTSSGIRPFVIGTGGTFQRPFQFVHNGSVVRNHTTWGVVEFELRDGSYNWDFKRTSGDSFSDSGYGTC